MILCQTVDNLESESWRPRSYLQTSTPMMTPYHGVNTVLTINLANPPLPCLDPEYQQALEEYMREQNMNPIFGISSKKNTPPPSIDDLELS